MLSPVVDSLRRWVGADDSPLPLARFRRAFAAIWLGYDALDLALGGTARIVDSLGRGSPPALLATQTLLVTCEGIMLVARRPGLVMAVTFAAAVLRAFEWASFLHLNDFAYYVVTAFILAHARADRDVMPRWPRDVLLFQTAWIYLATGFLKLNPAWLSGGHLFVRLEYLHVALGWPYPAFVTRCAESLPCDRALAVTGAVSELTLGVLLVCAPKRRVVLPLSIAIHAVGALVTNVWFFGPSLIAEVGFLSKTREEP